MNHFESSVINLIWTKKLVLLYYKTFYTDQEAKKARAYVPGKLLQHSLIFAKRLDPTGVASRLGSWP
jgi:hypothetical protein